MVVAESLASFFDLVAGGAGLAGVVEEDAAVVGLLAGDEAELVPAFDALGVGGELLGDLVEGEQAGVAEPLVVAAEAAFVAVPGAWSPVQGDAMPPWGAWRVLRMSAVGAKVWSSSSWSISSMTSLGVLRSCQALSGTGRCRTWCRPPGKRMAAVMACWPRVRVTSVSSRRMRRLRSRAGVAGVVPEGGEVGCQGVDAGALGGIERDGRGLGGGVVVASGGQLAQRGVPVGFEGVGDEPVAGVDGQVAAAGLVGGVLGALDVRGAQGVGVFGVADELVADGEGGLERERGEGVQQQAGDRGVDGSAGQVLADRLGLADAVVLAHVVGHDRAVVAGVVPDGHAAAAGAADDEALQQGGAFAWRAGFAVLAAGGGVGGQHLLVGLVLRPGDVAGVVIYDQHGPVVDRLGQLVVVSVQVGGVAGPAITVSAGVGRVVQGLEDLVVGQAAPVQLAGAGPLRCRPGKVSWVCRKALTTANAEPVEAKVLNRWLSAPRIPVSGSRLT